MTSTFDLRAISGALNSSLGVFTTQAPPPIPPDPLHVGPAELPRVVPQYTPSNSLTGTVHTPADAAALQALTVEGAGIVQPGDTIVLTRGVIYNTPSIPTQRFREITGAATNPIRVITSDTSAIPTPGRRWIPEVHRAAAPHFRCQGNNTTCVEVRGSGWHFVGIEADAGDTTTQFGVVNIGPVVRTTWAAGVTFAQGEVASGGWLSLQNGNIGNPLVEGVWWRKLVDTDLPTNVVLDRCDIAGRTHGQVTINLWWHTRASVITGCHLATEGMPSSEDKAVAAVMARGPWLFDNNTCIAGSIPLLTGGADPGWDVNPTDITFSRNLFGRPERFLPRSPNWDGLTRQHKNCFEFKVAVRALVEDNVFLNHYDGFQSQFFAVVFKCTNQNNTHPAATTEDITFRYNRLVNVGGGFALGTIDSGSGQGPVTAIRRFSVYENYTQTPLGFWNNVGSNERSWAFQLAENDQFRDCHIERNTLVSRHPSADTADSAIVVTTTAQIPGLVARGNVLDYGEFGIFGDAGSNRGIGTFQGAGSSASGNWLFVDTPSSAPTLAQFPAGQLTTTTDAAQVFVGRANGNYRTAAAIATQGHDGGRPGADIDTINARTAGCETGVWT